MALVTEKELDVQQLLALLSAKLSDGLNNNLSTSQPISSIVDQQSYGCVSIDNRNKDSNSNSSKRIGIMKIDPKVYDYLGNPCEDLFE